MAEGNKTEVIERLSNCVLRLKENYRQALEDKNRAEMQVAELKAEIEQMKAEIAQSKRRVDDVETEQRRLITARGFVANEGDTKGARLRVNRLVREIDKCISLLNE